MENAPAAPRAQHLVEWASRHREIAQAVEKISDDFASQTPPAPLVYAKDELIVPFAAPRALVFSLRASGESTPRATLRFDFDPATGAVTANVSGSVKLRRKTLLDKFTGDWAGKIARDALIAALAR
jgi:hypothetical protein